MKKLLFVILSVMINGLSFTIAQIQENDSVNILLRSNLADSIKMKQVFDHIKKKGDFNMLKYAEYVFDRGSPKELYKLKMLLIREAGFIFQQKGMSDKALNCYSKGFDRARSIQDTAAIVDFKYKLGHLYYSLGQFKSAYIHFSELIPYLENTKNAEGKLARVNYVLAETYLSMDSLEKGIILLKRTIDFFEKNDRSNFLAFAYSGICRVYLDKNDFTNAELYANKIVDLSSELKLDHELNIGREMLLRIYNKTGKHTKALQIGNEMKAYVFTQGFNDTKMTLNFLMYETNMYLNNYKEAATYLKKAYDFKDTLFKLENSKNLNDMSVKYETEKKNLEIENQKLAIEKKNEENSKIEGQKKLQMIIFVIVALFLVINGIVFYNRFKTSQKQNAIIEEKKKEVEHQKNLVEEKQKEIIDSINYAKRIQYTLLAHDPLLMEQLKDHFTYYQPKDIVSGDFYWATTTGNSSNELFYLAVCDSTGHGVPGAFMSLLNISFLNEAINERKLKQPHLIFDFVRKRLIENMSKEGQKDGFDGILLCIEKTNGVIKEITYAAANNAPILISGGNLHELEYDRMPVGIGERKNAFALHKVEFNPDDSLYLYTDGYADQFGGPRGKKFKYKQLNDLLVNIHKLPTSSQKEKLQNTFNSWKGDLEQVDDVCIIGIKL